MRVRLDHEALALVGVGPILALAGSALGATFDMPKTAADYDDEDDDERDEDDDEEDDDIDAKAGSGSSSASRVPAVAPDSVGVLRVRGPLAQRARYDMCAFVEGYDRLEAKLGALLEDSTKTSIVLVIDSPGGEFAGCIESVRRMRSAAKNAGKPVVAFVDECATSAAYAIATVAETIVIPETGDAGSIGTLCVHWDHSGALKQAGVDPTVVTSGSRKAEFSPFQPLSDEARARLQSMIDSSAKVFGELVAEARGKTGGAWLALEADVFTGAEAVARGLADRVGSLEDAYETAEQAGRENSTDMPLDKLFAAALGVKPEATADDLRVVGQQAEIGRAVQSLVGKDGAGDVIGAVGAWKDAAAKVQVIETAERERTVTAERAERVQIVQGMVDRGTLARAKAWNFDEKLGPDPVAGVKAPWSTMAIADLRTAAAAFTSPSVALKPASEGNSSTPPDEIAAVDARPGALVTRKDGVATVFGTKIKPENEKRARAEFAASMRRGGQTKETA